MSFLHGGCLVLLVLVPLAIWAGGRRGARAALRFSSTANLAAGRPGLAFRLRWIVPALRAAALGLLIVALARPRQGVSESQVFGEGIGILMVVDRSGSMRTEDFELQGQPISRLEAVKQVLEDFVLPGGELPGRPGDLIGLETFARYPDVLCPLTLEHGGLVDQVKALGPVELQSEDGTAIGDAIVWGIERLREAPLKPKSRVMILLTDGINNTGVTQPVEAAKIAAGLGLKIYTIGVGGQVQRVRDPLLGGWMLRATEAEIDEATLTAIANLTKGRYFRAKDTPGLLEIYRDIDQMEKSQTQTTIYLSYNELYGGLAAGALVLLVLEQVLSATRFRRIP